MKLWLGVQATILLRKTFRELIEELLNLLENGERLVEVHRWRYAQGSLRHLMGHPTRKSRRNLFY